MDIYLKFKRTILFHKNKILIADPFLLGPVFERSVVYLNDHSEEGAMGFILNNPTGFQVDEIVPNLKGCKQPVYYGGPVDEAVLFYIHKLGNLIENSIEIEDGLYWGGEFEDLKNLVLEGKASEENIKFFIGYSGWETNQLENEMNKNSWIISELMDDELFKNHTKEFWNKKLKLSNSDNAFLSQFAHNPSLN